MQSLQKHIDVEAPAAHAYAQWTQFEVMPRYMDFVEAVEQLDDRRLRWQIRAGDRVLSWEARITEQIPDKRIAWTSTSGLANAGCVTFHRLADDRSRVMLQVEVDPQRLVDNAAGRLGLMERGLAHELENFKRFVEARKEPTGRWEGAIPSPDERPQSR